MSKTKYNKHLDSINKIITEYEILYGCPTFNQLKNILKKFDKANRTNFTKSLHSYICTVHQLHHAFKLLRWQDKFDSVVFNFIKFQLKREVQTSTRNAVRSINFLSHLSYLEYKTKLLHLRSFFEYIKMWCSNFIQHKISFISSHKSRWVDATLLITMKILAALLTVIVTASAVYGNYN
jgi:hypothetical protein